MKYFSTRTYRFLRAVVLGAFRLIHPKVVVRGRENIPEGACILCGNHSAFSDPIWLVGYADLPELPRIMAKSELSSVPVLGKLIQKLRCIYINRGTNDLTAIKTALKTLRDGDKLVIFPEGTRVRDGKTSEPHIGAMLLASRGVCPVIPVYVTAKKKLFRPIHVIFDKPMYPQSEGDRPSPQELEQNTKRLMDAIYRLGEEI